MAHNATSKESLPQASAAFDPGLLSLFASSSGPVTAPVRSSKTSVIDKDPRKERIVGQHSQAQSQRVEVDTTSEDSSLDSEDDIEQSGPRARKRRKLSQDDDLETSYLNRLAKEEQKEDLDRRKNGINGTKKLMEDEDETSSSASNDLEDLSDLEEEDAIPQHESLTAPDAEYDKARRTVFLSNVSIDAIQSKASRKELESHLKSVLAEGESIDSLRFRSTAFNVTAGPKKAAYAKKDLMDETTKSTNAYVVLTSEAAARKISKQLNGTVILDRHLHTDWLAHPMAVDHKRCVFVGNLNFVDLESNADIQDNGQINQRRPRAKEPADAEEGLWRVFSKYGTVENVRVVRDKATRVGKGFAYVQFSDEVGAEKALALDGKKFPPMLPRLLRVSRAKRVLKKDLKRKREETGKSHENGRSKPNSFKRRDGSLSFKKGNLNSVVFEGYRASADKGMKFKTKGKKKKGAVRPNTRSSKRGAAFRAGGGKKKRDA